MALDSTRLAYLAGVFDGEGSICIRQRGRSGRAMDFRAQVSMTDREPLELFREAFGGGLVHYDVPKGGRKGVYRWAASSNPGLNALRLMLPYLTVKRRKAEIAIAVRATGTFNRSGVPDDVHEVRTRLAEEFRRA